MAGLGILLGGGGGGVSGGAGGIGGGNPVQDLRQAPGVVLRLLDVDAQEGRLVREFLLVALELRDGLLLGLDVILEAGDLLVELALGPVGGVPRLDGGSSGILVGLVLGLLGLAIGLALRLGGERFPDRLLIGLGLGPELVVLLLLFRGQAGGFRFSKPLLKFQ